MDTHKTAELPFEETAPRLAERDQITVALNTRAVRPLLEQAFGLELSAGASCRIQDTKYEPGEYCLLLYRLGSHMVIGSFNWDHPEKREPEQVRVVQPIGMHAYLFPFDPALPLLPKAIDPDTIAQELEQILPECQTGGMRIIRSKVKVMRYRPGKRCTERLDIWLLDPRTRAIQHKTLFAKIYHDLKKAAYVYNEMQALSNSTPSREGRMVMATAAAFLPDLAMVLQEPVQGVPLDGYLSCRTASLSPRGEEGILRTAEALAALHTSKLVVGRERPIAAELARFKKRGGKIARVNAELGREMAELSDALAVWLDQLEKWGAEITVVHGDCKPGQFLLDQDQVALLDFDHCGMADPANDIGTYLATLEQMKIHAQLKNHGSEPACAGWVPGLKSRFLDVYCRAANFPDAFKLRATWYEAAGLLRKAIRGFERSPYSPLPAALVSGAWQVLKTLPPS